MKANLSRLLLAVILVVGVIAIAAYVYYDQTRVYTVRIATAGQGNLSNIAGGALAKIVTRENPAPPTPDRGNQGVGG